MRVRAMTLLGVVAIGCHHGGPSSATDAAEPADTAEPTDTPVDTSSDATVSACGMIPMSSDDAALRALADRIVDGMHAAGATGAHDDLAGDGAILDGMHITLDTTTSDPGTAAVALVAGLSGNVLVPGELSPYQPVDYSTQDQLHVVPYMRDHVGAHATRFSDRAALVVSVLRQGTSWQLIGVQITGSIALATESDVDQLESCTPAMTPAMVQTPTFIGANLAFCGLVGTYTYTGHADDTLAWRGDTTWQAFDASDHQNTPPVRWRIVHQGTWTVATGNYWPHIEEADSNCGGVVGFMLVVDLVSDAVLSYSAGIDCATC
jgi:hypothetical protein